MADATGHTAATPPDRFLARHPIFLANRELYAYELLFRSGPENRFCYDDGDQATAEVIHSSLNLFDLKGIAGGKKVFINLTRSHLVEKTVELLPPHRVVLEILETVQPDDEVMAACRRLKEHGYVLALDDFVLSEGYNQFLELADIVKVDFVANRGTARREIAERYPDVQLLAEKVENHEDVEEAEACGYDYLQGYFFCKPQMFKRRDIAPYKINYLRFLEEINRPDPDIEKVEAIVKQEVSLSIRLLRFMNSSYFALRRPVKSIQWALRMLGPRTVARWGSLMTVTGLASGKPAELVVLSLVRARFCELIAPRAGLERCESDLFLTGMLSLLDAILDRPMSDLMAELPVAEEIKATLNGQDSSFAPVFRLAQILERGDWQQVAEPAAQMKIQEDEVWDRYREALAWADAIFALGEQ